MSADAATHVMEFIEALTVQTGTANPVVATLVTRDGRVLTLRATDIGEAITGGS